ncbi:MAG: dihydrofolate reductase family protein [Nitrospirota bacterium]
MSKLTVFNLVTLDGYFTGMGGDISWHNVDQEFQELAKDASNSGNTLLFGRVTYELMASYWPTPEAIKNDPIVARGMNSATKIVFSRTLNTVGWSNTRLVKNGMLSEIQRLKKDSGKDLIVLGSGSIVSQLAEERLIDEYQILLNPVVIGKGRTMFEDVKDRFSLKLTKSRVFGNGNVLLHYTLVK